MFAFVEIVAHIFDFLEMKIMMGCRGEGSKNLYVLITSKYAIEDFSLIPFMMG